MPSRKLHVPRTVRWHWVAVALLSIVVTDVVYSQQQPAKKPNILVIMGDDIGWFNASCYNHGIMGYQPQTSTGLPQRAACSIVGTGSRVVPPVGQHSLPANHQFALD
jgi:hypothetical protein